MNPQALISADRNDLIWVPREIVLEILTYVGFFDKMNFHAIPFFEGIWVPSFYGPRIKQVWVRMGNNADPLKIDYEDNLSSYKGPGWVVTEDGCVLPPLPFTLSQ